MVLVSLAIVKETVMLLVMVDFLMVSGMVWDCWNVLQALEMEMEMEMDYLKNR